MMLQASSPFACCPLCTRRHLLFYATFCCLRRSVMCCMYYTLASQHVAGLSAAGKISECLCVVVVVDVVLFPLLLLLLLCVAARLFLLPVTIFSICFWYLTFIWNCHARCWLFGFSAGRPAGWLADWLGVWVGVCLPAQRLCWLQRSSCG